MELRVVFFQCLVTWFSVVCYTLAARNRIWYCGACLGLVEEMNWGISLTDPKKTVQVGSFRIDSQGKQALNEIPLKRSEMHLYDILEGACNEVGRYVQRVSPETGKTNFMRLDSREGFKISMKHIDIDEHQQKTLKLACDTIVEEHEDDLMGLYKRAETDVGQKFCVDIAGYCKPANITELEEAKTKAVSDAFLEERILKKQKKDEKKKKKEEEKARQEAEKEQENQQEEEETGSDSDDGGNETIDKASEIKQEL